jgi:hypothetical protein
MIVDKPRIDLMLGLFFADFSWPAGKAGRLQGATGKPSI